MSLRALRSLPASGPMSEATPTSTPGAQVGQHSQVDFSGERGWILEMKLFFLISGSPLIPDPAEAPPPDVSDAMTTLSEQSPEQVSFSITGLFRNKTGLLERASQNKIKLNEED